MARKKEGLTFYQKEKKINKSIIRELLEMLIGTVVIIFLSTVIIYSFGMRTMVVGDSMNPSLDSGQEILIDQFVYMISAPKRGDVVVFLPHGNENTHYYVKRIIGLPGETITINKGHIYIDGILLEEQEEYDVIADAGIAENDIVLGTSEYFVLGDNRNSSEDSRSANIGPVNKRDIVGKAWFHMGSYNMNMGRMERANYKL